MFAIDCRNYFRETQNRWTSVVATEIVTIVGQRRFWKTHHWSQSGPDLVHTWSGSGPDLAWVWSWSGPDLVLIWLGCGGPPAGTVNCVPGGISSQVWTQSPDAARCCDRPRRSLLWWSHHERLSVRDRTAGCTYAAGDRHWRREQDSGGAGENSEWMSERVQRNRRRRRRMKRENEARGGNIPTTTTTVTTQLQITATITDKDSHCSSPLLLYILVVYSLDTCSIAW